MVFSLSEKVFASLPSFGGHAVQPTRRANSASQPPLSPIGASAIVALRLGRSAIYIWGLTVVGATQIQTRSNYIKSDGSPWKGLHVLA